MAEYEVEGELVTDKDYQRFFRTWKDSPKFCKCGAELSKLQLKCKECIRLARNEYVRERYKNTRGKGGT
jgi:hypothetical protein